jgi:hypothetical protein
MRVRHPALLVLVLNVAACVQQPSIKFEPSRKSAVELRAMQVRVVDAESDMVMRGVITTLHDLGYRVTRVDAGARTVSATRQTALRIAVVVTERPQNKSVVRANATMVAVGREAQVDSPEFYSADFFNPLGETLRRDLASIGEHDEAPEPMPPVAETTHSRSGPSTTSGSPSTPSTRQPSP